MVRGYQQFEDLDLDLTNPTTGEPLDRVCFLGSNGTGKTTILEGLLRRAFQGDGPSLGALILRTIVGANPGPTFVGARGRGQWTARFIDAEQWLMSTPRFDERPALDLGGILAAVVGADVPGQLAFDPPRTTLSEAMRSTSMGMHYVGPHTADQFWAQIMRRLAKRQESYLSFLEKPENSSRTQGELRAEFARLHPELLPALATLWNKLLEPAGLELDLENVKLPSQLTDSLSLHVRVSRTKAALPYNALSSGLRSFLFRLGYLKTLFFEPPHGSSFVLVDEPEASLHPDFLYDIVDVYQSVCVGSQLFFATHSPIVAAQFKPEERVILEFDENRFVRATRGTAPEGDDPNDLLRTDFHVRSLLGKEGVKKWKRFLELDELLRRETDATRRSEYRREYMEIGAAYNFEPLPHA